MSKIKFCSKNFDNMKSEKKIFDFKNSLFLHGFQPNFVWFRQQSITIQQCLCLKDHYSSKKIIERISRPCKHTDIVFLSVFVTKNDLLCTIYTYSVLRRVAFRAAVFTITRIFRFRLRVQFVISFIQPSCEEEFTLTDRFRAGSF